MYRLLVLSLLVLPSFSQYLSADELDKDSFDLSLQELLDVEVTSVSKQRQPLSNAPAAIYVLSNDDIVKSGATSIPQALREVPGLHVAQIDSQKWAVSSRGFNGRYNNKLLVMMDGRTLYSPEFSGVYWEVQDYLMADIDRIEIIRGPSAAMWGANAVNGVINIITKHSAETLGGYTEFGAGDYEQIFAGIRYGAKLADDITARVYAKGFARDSLSHDTRDMDSGYRAILSGLDTDNDWDQIQAGGRLDMQIDPTAAFNFSADIYHSNMQQVYQVASLNAPYREFINDEFDSRGWNLMATYTKALSASSEYSFQAYYDYVNRGEELFGFTTDTLDFDFQHQFSAWQNHNFVWGLGYRNIKDDIDPHPSISSTSELSTSTNLWSLFIRDEIELLSDKIWLTLASRFEHNSYTGFEVQPNIRLMWDLNSQHKIWSSIARAVRTPSRAENNLNINALNVPPTSLPTPTTQIWVLGNSDFDSEEVLSYEVGYRFSPNNKLSFDSAMFYNNYDKLRGNISGVPDFSTIRLGYITQPLPFVNDQSGHNYGFELSSQWLAAQGLRLKLNYGYVQSHFSDMQSQNVYAPKHILSAHADWSLNADISLNVSWRYVDNVKILNTVKFETEQLEGYHGVDLALRWQITPSLSLAAYGKSLLFPGHVEYEAEQFHIPYRVEPNYFVKITLVF